MTAVRHTICFVLAAMVAACSGPTPEQKIHDSELSDLAQLKQHYPDVVMGFDLRHDDTLIISLDLQQYIGMDDDAVAALKRDALARWRSAWIAAHPHQHALLHLHFIDFIGRRVADETAQV